MSPARATEFDVRVLEDAELRTANTIFNEAVHEQPPNDEKWATTRKFYEPGRTFGAFAGDTMIGTTTSLTSALTVPGGAVLPMAAVTGVAVRTDHRRRGALTGLMREQLAAVARGGEVFAALHASEATIYGRFGYGIGTLAHIVRARPARARMRPEVPTTGTMRLLTQDEALTLLPEAYSRMLGAWPGMMGRGPSWWALCYERRLRHEYFRVAAHHGADGAIDGFLQYRPSEQAPADPRDGVGLVVYDFVAADQAVANDLWRFLLDIDLVDHLTAYQRPTDEPLAAALVDSTAVRSELDDDLWLRLVDVPAALSARAYGPADPVVVEVVDPLLPANTGTYVVGAAGAERTEAPAALTVDPEALAMLYLGAWRPSQLAGIGRVTVHDPAALPAADRLFGTERAAWCGSLF
ncbi:hypothetical protein BU204_07950 [Actinophytocola xanthii]|uniref:Uncharacterized protein n=1 Tax=Actinophytocola xanthii TaxID=1912961 RepID=A0A1Q8CUW7_9PSEU|nr:hypothetical protein BU204_07950 [Actinophytocola xanthii]